jgi:hypothetical protein
LFSTGQSRIHYLALFAAVGGVEVPSAIIRLWMDEEVYIPGKK